MTTPSDSRNPSITCRFCSKTLRQSRYYSHIASSHSSDFWDHKPKFADSNRDRLKKKVDAEDYVPIRVYFKEEKDGDDFYFNPASLCIYRKYGMAKKASDSDKGNSLYKKNAEAIISPNLPEAGKVQIVIKEVVKEVIKEVPVSGNDGGNLPGDGKVVAALVKALKKAKAQAKVLEEMNWELESKFKVLAHRKMFTEEEVMEMIIPPLPSECTEKGVCLDPKWQERRKLLQNPVVTEDEADAIEPEEMSADVKAELTKKDAGYFKSLVTDKDFKLIEHLLVDAPKPAPEPEKPVPVVAPEPVPEPPKPVVVEVAQETPLAPPAPKPKKMMKVAQKAAPKPVVSDEQSSTSSTVVQSVVHPANPPPAAPSAGLIPAQKFSLQQISSYQYHSPAPSFPPLVLRTTR